MSELRVPILTLREPHRIAWILNRVLRARGRLTVRVAGSREVHSSFVLDADPRLDHFHLDELFPVPPPSLVAPGRRLHIAGHADNNQFEIDAEIRRSVMIDRIPALELLLPKELHFYERRSVFRVRIPSMLGLAPALLEGPGGPIRGRLVDISRTGACADIPNGASMQPGMEMGCVVSLPSTRVMTDVEVRSLAAALGHNRIGLRFLRLSKEQEKRLAVAISELERRVIRTTAAHA